MITNNEVWKDVIGYERCYQISSLGRLKRKEKKIVNKGNIHTLRERIINPYRDKKGYLVYRLKCDNGKIKRYFAHRLVAIHFISNPENKPEVNHIDGNKENNCVNNLEWVTTRENINHAVENSLRGDFKGESNGYSKLTDGDVIKIKTMLLNNNLKQAEIAKIFNVSPSTISLIKRGKIWTHIT